jgi:putative oxidoreductase
VTRIAHVLAGVVGMFFAGIGAAKIGGQFGLEDFLALGWPLWVYQVSGIVELFGGLALLHPRTRRAASLALLGVIAVLCWQPATHSYGPTAGGGVMIALLLGVFLSTVVREEDAA